MDLENLSKTTKALAVAVPLMALSLPTETEAAGVHVHRDITINKVWNGHGYSIQKNVQNSRHFNPSTTSPSVSRSRSVNIKIIRPPVHVGFPIRVPIIVPFPIIHPHNFNPFPVPYNHFAPRPIYHVAPLPIRGHHGPHGHQGHNRHYHRH